MSNKTERNWIVGAWNDGRVSVMHFAYVTPNKGEAQLIKPYYNNLTRSSVERINRIMKAYNPDAVRPEIKPNGVVTSIHFADFKHEAGYMLTAKEFRAKIEADDARGGIAVTAIRLTTEEVSA